MRDRLAVVAVVVLSCFAACGGSGDDDGASPTTAAESSTTAPTVEDVLDDDVLIEAALAGDPLDAGESFGWDAEGARGLIEEPSRSAAVADGLVAAGYDLAGLRIEALVTADGATRLLVLAMDDGTVAGAGDGGEAFLLTVLGSMESNGLTRLVVHYTDVDGSTVTLTTSAADLRAVESGSASIEDVVRVETGGR